VASLRSAAIIVDISCYAPASYFIKSEIFKDFFDDKNQGIGSEF